MSLICLEASQQYKIEIVTRPDKGRCWLSSKVVSWQWHLKAQELCPSLPCCWLRWCARLSRWNPGWKSLLNRLCLERRRFGFYEDTWNRNCMFSTYLGAAFEKKHTNYGPQVCVKPNIKHGRGKTNHFSGAFWNLQVNETQVGKAFWIGCSWNGGASGFMKTPET